MPNDLTPLVLWGGNDINPEYYKEKPLSYTQRPLIVRDREEFYNAGEAIKQGRPIIGICRGAQLLCILHGGSLYQHSQPHKQNHSIEAINPYTPNKELGAKNTYLFDQVSASHHQIMKPAGKFEVLAWNPSPTKVWNNETETEILEKAPEIVWWPETRCLGIQAHPEWGTATDPFVRYVDKLLYMFKIEYSFKFRQAFHWI
jgi:putative glutamine amidotransferase